MEETGRRARTHRHDTDEFAVPQPSTGRTPQRRDDEGVGIGGGIGQAPEGFPGHVTFYVAVPDVEAAMAQAERLGGTRLMGPDKVLEGLEIGMINEPEGHVIGLTKATS